MTYEQYRMIFYIALAVCIILFLLTVMLFFVLKIPKVFGDITGLSKRKAIKNINKQNEIARLSSETSSKTDRMSPSGRIISDYTENTVITEKIETEQTAKSIETVMLSENIVETSVLNNLGASETTLLTEQTVKPSMNQQIAFQQGFAKEIQSIVFIHTDEIVE